MRKDKKEDAARRCVLVTGACGGMGRAAVEHLVSMGFRVFAMDRVPHEERAGVVPLVCDVTDEKSVRAAFERVREQVDTLYAIVHFAGIYMLDSLVEMDEQHFDRIFQVNLRGAYLVNRTFLPLLSRESRILMTTSELAVLDPLPFTGIYAVTKAALDKYAYSLCMELQLLGVRVSVLRAGAVETGMLGVSTAALEDFCQRTQLYRCNADRFRRIVARVEARCVPPQRIARRVGRILTARRPSFAYSINRNPLLLVLNVLPKRVQLWAIRAVLR